LCGMDAIEAAGFFAFVVDAVVGEGRRARALFEAAGPGAAVDVAVVGEGLPVGWLG